MAIGNTTVAQTCPDVFLEWHHAPKARRHSPVDNCQQSPCNSELQWSSRAAATLRASCDRRPSVDATDQPHSDMISDETENESGPTRSR